MINYAIFSGLIYIVLPVFKGEKPLLISSASCFLDIKILNKLAKIFQSASYHLANIELIRHKV